MPRPKCFGIKTTNTSIHGSFTSRLTQFIIFQIGSFSGEIFLVQFQKYSWSMFNMDLLNSTRCLILRNHEFPQIKNIFPVLLCLGYFPGNTDIVRRKTKSNFHPFNDMHLSSGGISLMHQRPNQIR